MGRTACTVQLYLYSPYGPYSLYRASVPVQYSYTSTPPMDRTACTESQCLYSTAILLLPLWAVRSVQNLSACTVQLYLYSPYRPYGLYGTSVPVQGRTLPFPFYFITPAKQLLRHSILTENGTKHQTDKECAFYNFSHTIYWILSLSDDKQLQKFIQCQNSEITTTLQKQAVDKPSSKKPCPTISVHNYVQQPSSINICIFY